MDNGTLEYSMKSCFATLPRTTRAMPLVLHGDPKGKNFLYCNGTSVVIRNIDEPSLCELYVEHSNPTTVACYAPTGFYIASGDQKGRLRIWDATQPTHILKGEETQPISGGIRDIAWSPDAQRVAVVGQGREKFGHVFLFDTGTSNGSIGGQSKSINTIDFRPCRPFRLITASEDYSVAIFEGPPFKFMNSFRKHQRFAHCARYNPSGSLFASCGADGKLFLFDGDKGEPLDELIDTACKDNAHSGGIYSLSWSGDGRQLLTSSGDHTCKIWDVEAKKPVTTFTFDNNIENQQLGSLWQGNNLLSISFAGFIYYLDPSNPNKFRRIVKGHNHPITAVAADNENRVVYTGDTEGQIMRWNCESGDSERLEPRYHKSQIQGLSSCGNKKLLSCAIDDTLVIADLNEKVKDLHFNQIKLSSQPRGTAVSSDGRLICIASVKEVTVLNNEGKVLASLNATYEPSCIDIHPNKEQIAVGGATDKSVHILKFNSNQLNEEKVISGHNGALTSVKYSPNGNILAVCDQARRVVPYKVTGNWETASSKEWTFHTARVNCLDWNQDNKRIVTGSLDTNLIVWNLDKSGEHPIIVKNAHQMSQITGVKWLDASTVLSVGHDGNLKQWVIQS